jgi:hypothetical protein
VRFENRLRVQLWVFPDGAKPACYGFVSLKKELHRVVTVVFSDNFHSVYILDNNLNSIGVEEFIPLASPRRDQHLGPMLGEYYAPYPPQIRKPLDK